MPVLSPVGSWNSIGRIVSTNRIELQERRCIKGQSRGKIKKFFTWFCTKTIIIIIKRIFHLSDNSWLKFCDHLPRANWIDFLPYNCFFSKQQIFFFFKKRMKIVKSLRKLQRPFILKMLLSFHNMRYSHQDIILQYNPLL